jgi:putative phosphoesterase
MLIAIVSDTHLPRGGRTLPEEFVDEIRGADLLLHAGDVVSASALVDLRGIGPPVKAVRGNVDAPELGRELPERLELALGGVVVGMVHDAGPAAGRVRRLRLWFPEAAAVIFGHSHIPLHAAADDGFQIFNPGSPTERRRAPHRSMGLAEVRDGAIAFRHVTLQ